MFYSRHVYLIFVVDLKDKNKIVFAPTDATVLLNVISIHEEEEEDVPAAQIHR